MITGGPVKRILRQLLNAVRSTRYGVAFGAANKLTVMSRLYGQTDKWFHGYMPYYERHFGPRRFSSNVVLEIGIGGGQDPSKGGGSLRVWRDYFFRSQIVGVDLYPKTFGLGSRVALRQADQSSHDEIRAAIEPFGAPDIVIDDGSHVGEHIIASFEALWPRLRPGGFYVIEDLSTSYWLDYGGSEIPSERTAIGLLQQLVGDVQTQDPTFRRRPDKGATPTPRHLEVAAVSVYPGIAFVEKLANS